MIRYINTAGNEVIAELVEPGLTISNAGDMLDIIAEIGMNGCRNIMIYESDLHPDFFRLSTGIAGEILQKFSNYRARLAIVGDFTRYSSKSLQDFIRECNRGNMVFFVDSTATGLSKLSAR